jgi:phenylacetate-CoA ligase
MTAIWNPEYEQIDRAKLKDLQLQRLQWVIKWAYERVPAYKQKFDKAGIKPKDIQSLDDLTSLPFTTKDELKNDYPYGFFALPMNKIVRIHSTSGTTGIPVVVGYSRGDLNTWAELVARIATAAGVTEDDLAQVSFGYGMFTGGFGLHYGLERVGAAVLPASTGNTERQIQIMRDFGTTVLIGTPSYALHLCEVADQMGVDIRKLPLRVGLFGSEPWSEGMRQEIEQRMGIMATDNYGLTEVMGPGVAGECEERNGHHFNEDHFIPEIIDPDTGQVLPYGETGELVITTLTKEGFPMIRYRTRDLTYLTNEPCPCGRTLIKMARVLGRTDDMLIIKGVNIFPSQIEQVLTEIEGIEPQYQIILKKKGALNDIEVNVEVSERVFPDAMRKLVDFERQVESRLQTVLGIFVKVKLVEPKSIERTGGKAKRIIDRRDA